MVVLSLKHVIQQAQKLQQIFSDYWADLTFMVQEFTRLEADLKGTVAADDDNSAAVLGRLQYFFEVSSRQRNYIYLCAYSTCSPHCRVVEYVTVAA